MNYMALMIYRMETAKSLSIAVSAEAALLRKRRKKSALKPYKMWLGESANCDNSATNPAILFPDSIKNIHFGRPVYHLIIGTQDIVNLLRKSGFNQYESWSMPLEIETH